MVKIDQELPAPQRVPQTEQSLIRQELVGIRQDMAVLNQTLLAILEELRFLNNQT